MELFAYFTGSEGDESLCGITTPEGLFVPLLAHDLRSARKLGNVAQHIANACDAPVRLVSLSEARVVRTVNPRKRSAA